MRTESCSFQPTFSSSELRGKPHRIVCPNLRYKILYEKVRQNQGARYLDPKTSRWISADPAMYQGDYIPGAPINDEAKKRNGNLPGQGGVFNYVNLHVYHYAGNNPAKYVDPTGRYDIDDFEKYKQTQNARKERTKEDNNSGLCNYNTLVGAVEEKTGKNLSREEKNILKEKLQSGDIPAVDEDGTVNRPNEVLKETINAVRKSDELSATYPSDKPNDIDKLDLKNVLTVRRFNKTDERSEHSNLGDSKGKFIWEPLTYNSFFSIRKGTSSILRYIVFTGKKK